MNKRLLVLGAGIGGLGVIKELRESGVHLDDLDIAIVDDDFSHVLGFTLPWAMRGSRDYPPDPAFLRAAPRKEARGARSRNATSRLRQVKGTLTMATP
jgi:NADH dehydrogenase FAD-containing subunit